MEHLDLHFNREAMTCNPLSITLVEVTFVSYPHFMRLAWECVHVLTLEIKKKKKLPCVSSNT